MRIQFRFWNDDLDEDEILWQIADCKAQRLLIYNEAQESTLVAKVDAIAPRDLLLTAHHPDLRYRHVQKSGWSFYLLLNEGEEEIRGKFQTVATGETFWLDVRSGQAERASTLELELGAHQMKILSVKTEAAAP